MIRDLLRYVRRKLKGRICRTLGEKGTSSIRLRPRLALPQQRDKEAAGVGQKWEAANATFQVQLFRRRPHRRAKTAPLCFCQTSSCIKSESFNTKRKNMEANKLNELSRLRYIEIFGAPGRRH